MTRINLAKAALLAATALFATQASAQVADNWDIQGDVTVSATNGDGTGTGDVTLDATGGGNTTGIDTAQIIDGFKNSISNAAVGASASSSLTLFNNSAVAGGDSAVATYEGGISVTALNSGAINVTSDIANSAVIGSGGGALTSGNSISIAGVGASASGAVNVTLASSASATSTPITDDVEYTTGGDVLIQAGDGVSVVDGTGAAGVGGNAADVTVTLANGIQGADIQNGSANSISVAAVGSSAGFNAALNISDSSTLANANIALGGALTVTASNGDGTNGAVTVTGAGGDTAIDSAQISGGLEGNSISTAAVGSSASVTFAQNFYDTADSGTGAIVTAASFSTGGDVTVSSANFGTVTNNTDITTSATIGALYGNSISVAAVGASASSNFSTTDYTGLAAASGTATTIGGNLTITAANVGSLAVSTGIASPTINTGANNSISAAAVGASASQAISHTIYAGQ